jgi:hypothetical protein
MFFGIRDPRSGIRDGKNPDPGSGINIPDPQHCRKQIFPGNMEGGGWIYIAEPIEISQRLHTLSFF